MGVRDERGAMSILSRQEEVSVCTRLPPLVENRVTLFLSCTDRIDPKLLSHYRTWLSDMELARLERYRFENKRREYLVGKALTRVVLANYCDCRPADLQFTYNAYGKPLLLSPHGLHFNLSHVGGVNVLSVSRSGPVGVDIECLGSGRANLAIAERWFNAVEYRNLLQHDSTHQHEAFLHLWTLKESFLKASGEGLTGSLAGTYFEVSSGIIQVRFASESNLSGLNWHFHLFRVLHSYICAVSVAASSAKPVVMNWFEVTPGGKYRPYYAEWFAGGMSLVDRATSAEWVAPTTPRSSTIV